MKTFAPQNIADAAANNPEADDPDIFPCAKRHFTMRAWPKGDLAQDEIEVNCVPAQSSIYGIVNQGCHSIRFHRILCASSPVSDVISADRFSFSSLATMDGPASSKGIVRDGRASVTCTI